MAKFMAEDWGLELESGSKSGLALVHQATGSVRASDFRSDLVPGLARDWESDSVSATAMDSGSASLLASSSVS